MLGVINKVNDIIWSDSLVYLLLGVGVFFTIATKAIQIRGFKKMVKLTFSNDDSEHGISSFEAFSIAVSGRVGTGNIAGVATAIALGGPGSVVWMWIIALLGSASAYVESALGQVYKEKQEGQYRGGPAYYIENGMGKHFKWFAVLFAIVAIISVGIGLPGVQSGNIAAATESAFGLSPIITGIILVLCLGFVIFGGVKRIGNVAEKIIPIMAIGYILVSIIIIVVNIKSVPSTFALMFKSAFTAQAAVGGIAGITIKNTIMMGVKRGLYSNEAAQGTGPHAAAAAEVSHPAKQGLVQAFSVYVDTLFVCTATALMILTTNSYNLFNAAGEVINNNLPFITDKGQVGPIYTQAAVESVLGGVGPKFVSIALLFFAFTTLMAYYYIAETNVAYLFKKSNKGYKIGMFLTKICILIVVFFGVIINLGVKNWEPILTGLNPEQLNEVVINPALNDLDAQELSSVVKGEDLDTKKIVQFTNYGFMDNIKIRLASLNLTIVWMLGDIGVGAMAWLNIIAILILAKVGLGTLYDYESQLKKGIEPIYNPIELKVKRAKFWEERIKSSSLKKE